MSKRSEHHEAERRVRREAYLAQRQAAQATQAEQATQSAATAPEGIELLLPAFRPQFPEPEVAAPAAPTNPQAQTAKPDTWVQTRILAGFAGKFATLPTESFHEFSQLAEKLFAEHQPQTENESLMVESIAQHYWRMQRALRFQEQVLMDAFRTRDDADARQLSLYLRYHAAHERSYYKALRELQNTQKQKRKDQIGFESQKRAEEMHDAKTRLIHAKAQTLEVDASCRKVMEAPIPGTHNIPFEKMAKACGDAIAVLASNERREAAGY